jgi:hypothetical protein
MRKLMSSSPWARPPRSALLVTAAVGLVTAVAGFADLPGGPVTMDQVALGRHLVLSHDCGGCHGHNRQDPGDPQWLSGFIAARDAPGQPFQIGPFKTYPANLTPIRPPGSASSAIVRSSMPCGTASIPRTARTG